jgi:hypothetical protein
MRDLWSFFAGKGSCCFRFSLLISLQAGKSDLKKAFRSAVRGRRECGEIFPKLLSPRRSPRYGLIARMPRKAGFLWRNLDRYGNQQTRWRAGSHSNPVYGMMQFEAVEIRTLDTESQFRSASLSRGENHGKIASSVDIPNSLQYAMRSGVAQNCGLS